MLLSDNGLSFNDNANWSPELYPYQQQAANVLFFSFIDPIKMVVAFAKLAKTRGSGAQGSVPANTMILFAIGEINQLQY